MYVTDVIKRIRTIIYNNLPMQFIPQTIVPADTRCSVFYGPAIYIKAALPLRITNPHGLIHNYVDMLYSINISVERLW